jgi:hypothetical protein
MLIGLQILPQRIECKRSDLEAVVLPLLRGRVFHVTEEATFEDISRSGWIYNHRQAQFTLAFGQSKNSYGRKRGWVSLFDLSNRTDAEIKEALIRYYFLRVFRTEHPCICLLFIAERTWSSLIPWQRAREEVGGGEMYIPFVEAWYPGDIPLDLVTGSLIVTIQSGR